MKDFITTVCNKFKNDKTRLLDIFWEIQDKYHYISPEALHDLSHVLKCSIPELKDTLTFYHFFHHRPAGIHKIFMDTSVMSCQFGALDTLDALKKELKVDVGEVSSKYSIGLFETSCIGMSDQLPAALVDGVPVTNLTANKVKKLIKDLTSDKKIEPRVLNKVRQKGPVFFGPYQYGDAICKLSSLTPSAVIEEIKKSNLRGRGGAGFPTAIKWQSCASQKEQTKYIVCNADEGEPGTFKDRFLITEMPELLIEGMVIAAFAIKAQEGIIYLRAEYRYLYQHLVEVLEKFRKKNFLGKNIARIKDFNFDLRIQLGAGAYVVGEETALLESLEGKRGEPRVRPPFPVEKGYMGRPTVVNNVETLSAISKIISRGASSFNQYGTEKSKGSKFLSVSGDCKEGIYEIEWGQKIGDFLKMVEAKEALAIQIGGPSGIMISAKESNRKISFEDLPTGGSMMVFNKTRNIFNIVKNFSAFFVDESCGCCLPCRAGNIVLHEQMNFIDSGDAALIDLERIKSWSSLIKSTSRCGLGQTCANPILTSMMAFPELYKKAVKENEPLFKNFDIKSKLNEYEEVVEYYEKKNHSDC